MKCLVYRNEHLIVSEFFGLIRAVPAVRTVRGSARHDVRRGR
jgi:hypothetical protein